MPLKAGKSKATVSENIGEMVESPTFAEDKSPEKRQQMAAAAAYRKARESGAKLPRKRRRRSKKTLAEAAIERS